MVNYSIVAELISDISPYLSKFIFYQGISDNGAKYPAASLTF
jgi:hypothetical protein